MTEPYEDDDARLSGLRVIPWNHVKRELVKVTWGLDGMQFRAVGLAEQKPHRRDDPNRIHLKLSTTSAGLWLGCVGADTETKVWEAGIGWDGWLTVPRTAVFRAIREKEEG